MVALQVNLEKQEYLQEATKLSDISLYSLMKKKKKFVSSPVGGHRITRFHSGLIISVRPALCNLHQLVIVVPFFLQFVTQR